MRATRQRSAVIEVLDDEAEFRSAQEIHQALRQRGSSVALSTVYRALAALTDDGTLDVLRKADGEQVFRRCTGGGNHHYLVCRTCGYSAEVDGPNLEKWARETAQENGFCATEHVIELFGVCSSCRPIDD